MEKVMAVLGGVLLFWVIVAGILAKSYTKKKLDDIDGLGGITTYDADEEEPPIGKF